jgi:hypothetical protein
VVQKAALDSRRAGDVETGERLAKLDLAQQGECTVECAGGGCGA